MSNKFGRIYVGSICDRDLEVLDEIRTFCKKNYNISKVTKIQELLII